MKHIILCLFLLPSISFAWSVPQYQVEFVQRVVIEATERYGADKGVALAIVEAESRYDCSTQSHYLSKTGPNGREDSWGCAQIHLPAHPSVSRSEAKDIYFMADFLASELAKGNCWIWTTCPLSKTLKPQFTFLMVDT